MVVKLKLNKNPTNLIIILIIIINILFICPINATPNSGEPIDANTSVIWKWNSSNSLNILSMLDYDPDIDYEVPGNYFFSCIGSQGNLPNNLTISFSVKNFGSLFSILG